MIHCCFSKREREREIDKFVFFSLRIGETDDEEKKALHVHAGPTHFGKERAVVLSLFTTYHHLIGKTAGLGAKKARLTHIEVLV